MTRSSDKSAAYEALPVSASKMPQCSEIDTPSENIIGPPREPKHLVKAWRWETFTFLLGTAAFAAILGMLLSFRNKPAWNVNIRTGAGEIQITAIIAALAQVAQSALLVPISYCIGQLKWKWFQKSNRIVDLDHFDMASRGPDGSVRLLWHFSWRQRLVSIGALATVLMLMFPTFVQQSVQEGSIVVEERNSDRATMPRATNIADSTRGNVRLYTLTGNGTASSYEVNMGLNDALRSGIAHMNPINPLGIWQVPRGTDAGLAGSCEQCSWDAFKTLALCFSGEDITREIILEDHHVSLPALHDFPKEDQEPPSFQSGLHGYTGKNRSTEAAFPATSVSSGTNLPNLAEVYYLFYDPCVDPNHFEKSNITHWRAYKGIFQFCIQTLNATGKLKGKEGTTMTLINSTANLDWKQETRGNYSAFCTKTDREEEDFCVSEPLMQNLAFHMNLIFNTTAIFSDPHLSDIQYSSEWGPVLTGPIYEYCEDSRFPRIWHFRDMLEGIAQSLTNKFRTDANRSEEVYGTFTYPQTVVLVDFRWLILPVALWIMIAIFFFSTIVTTRNTPMWKSSPLPLLNMMSSNGAPTSMDTIRKEAKKTWMGLGRTQMGWQMLSTSEERSRNREEGAKKRRAGDELPGDSRA